MDGWSKLEQHEQHEYIHLVICYTEKLVKVDQTTKVIQLQLFDWQDYTLRLYAVHANVINSSPACLSAPAFWHYIRSRGHTASWQRMDYRLS